MRQHRARVHGKYVGTRQRDQRFQAYERAIAGMPQCRRCCFKFSSWRALRNHIQTDACNRRRSQVAGSIDAGADDMSARAVPLARLQAGPSSQRAADAGIAPFYTGAAGTSAATTLRVLRPVDLQSRLCEGTQQAHASSLGISVLTSWTALVCDISQCSFGIIHVSSATSIFVKLIGAPKAVPSSPKLLWHIAGAGRVPRIKWMARRMF